MTDLSPPPPARPGRGPVRAPRGTPAHLRQLADRGGLPDDPEQPRSRGGREPGRAGRLRRHRQGGAQLGLLRGDPGSRCASCSDDETLLVQSRQAGRRVPHPRRRAARADRQLEPGAEVGDLGALRRARPQGPDDVRPDDGRLWIYIGSQGIVQGTYETFVEAGRQHYGGDLAGRWILTAGLGGMGGAQPLAATFAGAVLAEHRVPAEPHRLPPAHALPRRAGDATSTTRWRASRSTRREKRAVSIGLLGNAAEMLPELVRARAGGPARPRHRPDLGPRPGQRLPAGRLERRALARRAGRPGAARRACAQAAAPSCADARAGDARLPGDGRADGRLRQQHPPGRVRRRRRRTRSTSPASCRPTSGRCSAAARGRSAGSRCPATRRTSARPTPR